MHRTLLSDDSWLFLPDPENRGKDEGWAVGDVPSDACKVVVPSCIEETHPRTDGVVWYWKPFRLGDLPADEHHRICFEGVDYSAEAWLNGEYLGGNESALLPFAFDVTGVASEGDNLLAVRVIDASYGREIDGLRLGRVPGGRQHDDPWSPGHRHYNYGGILQDVAIERRGLYWIEDAFIQPSLEESSIQVNVEIGSRTGEGGMFLLEATVSPDHPVRGEPIAVAKVPVLLGQAEQDVHLTMYLPRAQRWGVHDAHLYRLDLSLLRDGAEVDTWSDRFGMREFSFRDGRVCVNGRPILLRGFLYNQIWPITLGRPYAQMARRDIELAREAGANLMRAFSKSPFRATLDACDELGVLMHVETLAAWFLWEGPTAERAKRLEDLMVRQVRRDRNHACVLWWCCLNETGGDLRTYAARQILPKLRTLDPTRILLNADNASPEGCVQWLPGDAAPRQHFEVRHWYVFENFSPALPVGFSLSGNMPDRVRALRGRNLLEKPASDGPCLYLSEWGVPHGSEWFALLETYAQHRPDLEDATLYRELVEHHRQQYALLKLDERGFPTLEAFLNADNRAAAKRYEEYLTTLWGNTRAVGHCLTSFEDSGHEISGVVDIWRRPKVATFQKIREMNSRLYLNLDWQPRTLYVGDPLNLDITLVNEHVLVPGDYYLSVAFQAPDQTVLSQANERVYLTGELVQPLFADSLRGPVMGGPHRLSVVLRAEAGMSGHEVSVHVRPVSVFERVPMRHIAVTPPVIWEDTRRLSTLLDRLGIPYVRLDGTREVGGGPIFISCSSLAAGDRDVWLRALRAWELGTPLVVLDHRFFAADGHPTGNFPDMDGWRPDPRLLAWDYGGVRCVTSHPLFRGLPQACSIGSTDIYSRVCPTDSWQIHDRPQSVECDIAAFHANMERRDPYTADLLVLTFRGRRMLLSTFNLVGNLGEAPAADRLVLNMLHYFSSR